jgi:hypothetical protein
MEDACGTVTHILRIYTDIVKLSAGHGGCIKNSHIHPEDMHRHYEIVSLTLRRHIEQSHTP